MNQNHIIMHYQTADVLLRFCGLMFILFIYFSYLFKKTSFSFVN
jgi:hypothetical protein